MWKAFSNNAELSRRTWIPDGYKHTTTVVRQEVHYAFTYRFKRHLSVRRGCVAILMRASARLRASISLNLSSYTHSKQEQLLFEKSNKKYPLQVLSVFTTKPESNQTLAGFLHYQLQH